MNMLGIFSEDIDSPFLLSAGYSGPQIQGECFILIIIYTNTKARIVSLKDY
jgi:hypothetical protein